MGRFFSAFFSAPLVHLATGTPATARNTSSPQQRFYATRWCTASHIWCTHFISSLVANMLVHDFGAERRRLKTEVLGHTFSPRGEVAAEEEEKTEVDARILQISGVRCIPNSPPTPGDILPKTCRPKHRSQNTTVHGKESLLPGFPLFFVPSKKQRPKDGPAYLWPMASPRYHEKERGNVISKHSKRFTSAINKGKDD